jgi:hypothetical protein
MSPAASASASCRSSRADITEWTLHAFTVIARSAGGRSNSAIVSSNVVIEIPVPKTSSFGGHSWALRYG